MPSSASSRTPQPHDASCAARAVLAGVTCFCLAAPCWADPLWHPGKPGEPLQQLTHNADGQHRRITWTRHAGFRIELDDRGVYDSRYGRDTAPQVRVELDGGLADLRTRDFVATVRTELSPGRGRHFHAGLCIGFGDGDMLVFGPQGSADLRFEWSATGNGVTASHGSPAAFLKMKRRGEEYAAWFSEGGVIWRKLHAVTIPDGPRYVGAVLMNWGAPHREQVTFSHFELTHVQGEPDGYEPDTIYGETDAGALHFVRNLSGVDMLVRLMAHKASGRRVNPCNSKLYFIHGASYEAEDDPYEALHSFRRICNDLREDTQRTYSKANVMVIAPRFPRGAHPYAGRRAFHYQTLRGEEDRLLIDLHEDFIRERFPADRPEWDDQFALLGHSGGGQFAARFLMAHARKLSRAVVSSPASFALPAMDVDWPYGTRLSDRTAEDNPLLKLDLQAAFDLPVAVVVGENDNLVDRGTEQERYRPIPLSYARLDGARKWVRQMKRVSKGRGEVELYVWPAAGHSFTAEKRAAALLLLLGSDADKQALQRWRYEFELTGQDREKTVAAVRIPDKLLHYFKFNRFRMPRGDRFERYELAPDGTCFITNRDGEGAGRCQWKRLTQRGQIRLTVCDERYTQPTVLYGKLRIYTPDMTAMIEQSPVVTPLFIREQVVGRRLHLYRCTGRGPGGPTGEPSRYGPLELEPGGFVVHAGTSRRYGRKTMQRWQYDNRDHLLRFTDVKGRRFDSIQVGDWRWGVGLDGKVFLAGLSTADVNDEPRMELQTDPDYNPRYFEQWDTGPETWPREGGV
jgi:pimeloyl-ACP methyl ester carboxylesterase